MEAQKIKIAVIEDNAILRDAIETYLEASANLCCVGKFHNCESALKQFETLRPDIVLMDIDLPGMSGVEGTKAIKLKYPKTNIIIVTVFENSETVFSALSAGATGYLTKTFTPESLISSIQECADGGAPMSTSVAKMVVNSFNKINPESPLSEREQEVLSCLAQGHSYNSIADALFVTVSTVKYHIKNIYIKLEVSSRDAALQIARSNKFI